MKIFALLDVKAKFYEAIFSDTSTPAALRGFDGAVNTPDSRYARFPHDFALMELGTVDPETLAVQLYPAPQHLGDAATVLRKPSEQNSLPFKAPVAQ